MSLQQEIIKTLYVKSTIDPKEEIRNRVEFLKNYLKKTGAKGYVLGISGGQDSTLAGRLTQLAVEELRAEGINATFIAVRLPYGTQQDEDDAQLAIQFIQPDQVKTFNIKSSVDAFVDSYLEADGQAISDYQKGNVKARLRMIVQYALGGMHGLLVVGTDHASEAVTGYYTKYGDGGADVTPLTGLNKRQGRALLRELGADERLYLKEPTADLLDNKPGQADETELGITYEEIDDYLEGKTISKASAQRLENLYKQSEHKRHVPANPYDEWWK